MNWFGSIKIDGVEHGGFLQLKAANFSETLFDACDEWDAAIAENEAIQSEKAKLLTIRSSGFSLGGAFTFG